MVNILEASSKPRSSSGLRVWALNGSGCLRTESLSAIFLKRPHIRIETSRPYPESSLGPVSAEEGSCSIRRCSCSQPTEISVLRASGSVDFIEVFRQVSYACIGGSQGCVQGSLYREGYKDSKEVSYDLVFFSSFISWALFCFEQGGGRAWVHKLLTVPL